MKRNQIALAAIAVSIIGLMSCSRDQTPVDDWKMTQPQVQADGQTALTVSNASRRTLPAATLIRFAEPNWTALQIKSECRYSGQTFKEDFASHFQPSLPLRALWPAELWRHLSEAELVKTECDFNFEVTNANGSTQTFAMTEMKLDGFSNAEHAARLANLTSTPALSEVAQDMTAAFRDEGHVSLICGTAEAALANRVAARTPDLVLALMAKLPIHGTQRCHFTAFDETLANSITDFEISKDFTLKFPLLPLKLDFTFNVADLDGGYFSNFRLPIVRFTVLNPNQESAFVRVESVSNVAFRMIFKQGTESGPSAGPFVESSVTQTMQTRTVATGANLSADAGLVTAYDIPPGKTLSVEIWLANENMISSCGTSVPYDGFRFGFTSRIKLTQLESVNSNVGVAILDVPPAEGESLPFGFAFRSQRSQLGLPVNQTFPRAYPSQPCL